MTLNSSTPRKKLFFALPAYNEALNLPKLLAELERAGTICHSLGFDTHYIIVDDGSADDTPVIAATWAQTRKTTIITHCPNQGLGLTISDALSTASSLANDGDVIVTLDADNTQPPGLIFSMLLKIMEGNDLVVASRYRYGSKVLGLAWHRHLMSFGAATLFMVTFPIAGIRDYTCGFRAYEAGFLKRAFEYHKGKLVTERGFQCMAEILLRLSKSEKYTSFVEVPMVLRYYQKQGDSKMRVVKTVFNTLKLLVKFRLGLNK
jgi:dolichol-phosphate mannosyltransferase